MLESIHAWLVAFVDNNFLLMMGLIGLLVLWPLLELLKIDYPSKSDYFPIEIKPNAIRNFISSLPVGFIFGILFAATSSSILGLLNIPICTIIYPFGSALFLSIRLAMTNQRNFWKHEKRNKE